MLQATHINITEALGTMQQSKTLIPHQTYGKEKWEMRITFLLARPVSSSKPDSVHHKYLTFGRQPRANQ